MLTAIGAGIAVLTGVGAGVVFCLATSTAGDAMGRPSIAVSRLDG